MKTMLVVDHDREVAGYVRDLLKDSGYTGLFASGFEEAIGIAREAASLDILLTAIQVPPHHGGDLASRLIESHPGLRVAFLSSHPVHLLERGGVWIPGSPLLRKPFTRVQLLDALDSALATPPWKAALAEAIESLEQAA